MNLHRKARALLSEIQAELFAEAKARLDGNIRSDLLSFEAIAASFGKAAARTKRAAPSRAGSARPGRV